MDQPLRRHVRLARAPNGAALKVTEQPSTVREDQRWFEQDSISIGCCEMTTRMPVAVVEGEYQHGTKNTIEPICPSQ